MGRLEVVVVVVATVLTCVVLMVTPASSTSLGRVTTTTTDTLNPDTAPPPGPPPGIPPSRSIVNPDFECGGARSSRHTRTARQTDTHGRQQHKDSPFEVLTSAPAEDGKVKSVRYASCGASPISPRFLLTAAYCVLDPDHPITSVRLGDIDLAQENENNSMPADYSITGIFLPDDFLFEKNERYADIALLMTDRDIEFNDFVFPYCVSASPPPLGTEVIVAGFGLVNETHTSTHLMEATLTVLPLAQCEKRYLEEEGERLREAYPSLLQGRNGLLCAGDVKSGVCSGDEGGPLFRQDETGRRFIEGVISFTGSHCGDGVLPGVFTAVADYVDFIDQTIYTKSLTV